MSVMLVVIFLYTLSACFRPAPPLEEGDNQTPEISTQTSPDGTVTVEAHPVVKRRVTGRTGGFTPSPASTVVPTVTVPASTASPAVTITAAPAPAWAQEAYLKAPNSFIHQNLGFSVSLSGETLAAAAYREHSGQTTITNGTTAATDNTKIFSGAVYVFRRSGGNWAQEAYIKAANSEGSDEFGYSVALSGDTLAVGAHQEDSNQTTISLGSVASADNSAAESGAVYVYRRTGSTWAQEAYIKAANAGGGDSFGRSVSLSANTLAVGAYSEDSNQSTITNGTAASADDSFSASGAVYVYRRNNGSWAQEAFIKASNAGTGDYFYKAQISGDTLVVGASHEDSNLNVISHGSSASGNNSSTNSGAAYVFRRAGIHWVQEAFIKASNVQANDLFGSAVTLSGDTLVVGAPGDDSNQTTITQGSTSSIDNTETDSGSAFVYRRTGNQWAQEAYLKAANAGASNGFGTSLALSGNSLVVGAPYEDSGQSTITNGAVASADNSLSNAGAVYLYQRTGGLWASMAYFKAANANADDEFGTSVSLSGNTLAVGVPNEDSKQTTINNGSTASADNSTTSVGAVYVYRDSSGLFDPDVSVTSTGQESISFTWSANLGRTTQIKIAPAAYGRGSSAENCSDAQSILLAPGVTNYTYSGLAAGTKYGFRFCAWDGQQSSGGATLWAETDPQNFETGTDNWNIVNNANPTTNRNQSYVASPSNKMFGPFAAGESISRSFQLGGESVTISFDFLRLNSWDGENFQVYVQTDSGLESQLISESFQHTTPTQTYFGSSLGYAWWISSPPANSFCFITCGWSSARHRVTIITPPGINSLNLRLTSTLDQGIADEAWGIDKFRLSP